MPINVSINDVLAGISAVVDTMRDYLFAHNCLSVQGNSMARVTGKWRREISSQGLLEDPSFTAQLAFLGEAHGSEEIGGPVPKQIR